MKEARRVFLLLLLIFPIWSQNGVLVPKKILDRSHEFVDSDLGLNKALKKVQEKIKGPYSPQVKGLVYGALGAAGYVILTSCLLKYKGARFTLPKVGWTSGICGILQGQLQLFGSYFGWLGMDLEFLKEWKPDSEIIRFVKNGILFGCVCAKKFKSLSENSNKPKIMNCRGKLTER